MTNCVQLMGFIVAKSDWTLNSPARTIQANNRDTLIRGRANDNAAVIIANLLLEFYIRMIARD